MFGLVRVSLTLTPGINLFLSSSMFYQGTFYLSFILYVLFLVFLSGGCLAGFRCLPFSASFSLLLPVLLLILSAYQAYLSLHCLASDCSSFLLDQSSALVSQGETTTHIYTSKQMEQRQYNTFLLSWGNILQQHTAGCWDLGVFEKKEKQKAQMKFWVSPRVQWSSSCKSSGSLVDISIL